LELSTRALYSVGVHIWIFRNQGVEEEQQDQDIPLEGLIVEEPPTPLQPISEIGTETETIARTNSQADNSYLAHQHRLKFKNKSVNPHPNTLAVVKLPAVEEADSRHNH